MSRGKSFRRAGYIALALLLAGGLMLPLARFGRFHGTVREALEKSLGRTVEIRGPVRLRIFPTPGFSAGDVIVFDPPSVGLEPLAYVSSFEVDLRLYQLLFGELDISNLRLVQPSVNLTKSNEGDWNYLPLVDRLDASIRVTTLQVREGRLNFKFGQTKSVFYIANADVDLRPEGGSREILRIRFSGEPARTDRPAQGYGKFSGSGRFLLRPEAKDSLSLVLRLERSPIEDVMTLLDGPYAGKGGFIASRAELEGPLSDVAIRGSIAMDGTEMEWKSPLNDDGWTLEYGGRLNLLSQSLTLDARSGEEADSLLKIHLEIEDYLRQPVWTLTIDAEELPLAGLPSPVHLILKGPQSNTLE